MCVGLWCLTAVFASATADAETDGKCHRGQARRARQEPDALRFEREIMVFPALAQCCTKNHQRPDADAGVRRVCGIYGVQRMRNGINHTVSPLGREADQLCPPTEDLEDLEDGASDGMREESRRDPNECRSLRRTERLSSLERKKRAVLTTSALSRYLADGRLL